jgi:S1-C subfamily serine protease
MTTQDPPELPSATAGDLPADTDRLMASPQVSGTVAPAHPGAPTAPAAAPPEAAVPPLGPPPWPEPPPGWVERRLPPAAVPAAPSAPPPAGGSPRPAGWRVALVAALVGALTGAGSAAGVYLATREERPVAAPVTVPATGSASRPPSVIRGAGEVQELVRRAEPAVVAIRTGAAVDGDAFGGGGAGTGFVVDPDGIIVTNNHVIAGAGGRIEVTFSDGTSRRAEVLGRSADNDLAVLRVDATGLPTLPLGSSEAAQVGDDVIAIGNALALEGGLSVTRGIISAKKRTVSEPNGATLYDVLQTDAAINPGNSGGPLMNAAGEVIGINTAIANPSTAQNVGFAISIDSAKPIIEELRAGRTVRTPYLGVYMERVTPAIRNELGLRTERGAVVLRVVAGSGADEAGLRQGDVILAVADQRVGGPEDVGAAIRRFRPGDRVVLRIEREGRERDVTVTLGTRPAD